MTTCLNCKCIKMPSGEHTVKLCRQHVLANEALEMLRLQKRRAVENMTFARIELKNLEELLAKFDEKDEN